MKVLLTGSHGQLGRCLLDRMPDDWQILAADIDSLDITDENQVGKVVNEFNPDVIINAAAYTAVDKAESDEALARLINVRGPENLAKAAKDIHARFVHVSTDYVFDGTSSTPYVETDKTHPLGVYGATKLDGELAVLQVNPESLIIRTSWVFSEYGNNFVKTMLRLAREKDRLNIVDDQRGCPTYAGDIAQTIITLSGVKEAIGVYHFCGDKEVSWKEFTDHIVATAKSLRLISKIPIISGISTDQYPTASQRPKYSTLCCRKIAHFGIKPSDWGAVLGDCLSKIIL